MVTNEPTAIAQLPEPYVWRSVNKREWPATGMFRHICKKGHPTSLCGTTALPATIWRAPRGEKPDCAECVAKLDKMGTP